MRGLKACTILSFPIKNSSNLCFIVDATRVTKMEHYRKLFGGRRTVIVHPLCQVKDGRLQNVTFSIMVRVENDPPMEDHFQ